MKVNLPLLVGVLSMAALLPATALLLGGVTFFIGVVAVIVDGKFFLPSGGIDYEFWYFALSYVTGVYAIWQFWLLAIETVRERQRLLSWQLWFAIVCGCISAIGLGLIGGARTFAFIVLPVCMLVAWLLHLQYRRLAS